MYFTGSKNHNVRLRERAIKKGMTLNEYGLFPESPDEKHDGPPQKRGVEPVACETEEAIYAALDLPWLAPEIREDRGELDVTDEPDLIRVEDIRAELHAHTTESDGSLPLAELVAGAKGRGFHTIAVTDQGRTLCEKLLGVPITEAQLDEAAAKLRERARQQEAKLRGTAQTLSDQSSDVFGKLREMRERASGKVPARRK